MHYFDKPQKSMKNCHKVCLKSNGVFIQWSFWVKFAVVTWFLGLFFLNMEMSSSVRECVCKLQLDTGLRNPIWPGRGRAFIDLPGWCHVGVVDRPRAAPRSVIKPGLQLMLLICWWWLELTRAPSTAAGDRRERVRALSNHGSIRANPVTMDRCASHFNANSKHSNYWLFFRAI